MKKPLLSIALVALSIAVLWVVGARLYKPYPPDTTPEGAYLRVARAFAAGRPEDAFAYTETEAQWASYTLRDNRKAALARAAGFPAEERARLHRDYDAVAACNDGADVFAHYASTRKWDQRMRKDLSGVDHVERAPAAPAAPAAEGQSAASGERATVVTAKGTRYTFRKRDNGIWGMTMFTADLLSEAARSAQDLTMLEGAAEDYARRAAQAATAGPAEQTHRLLDGGPARQP